MPIGMTSDVQHFELASVSWWNATKTSYQVNLVLVNVHLFDMLPAISSGKSGIFLSGEW